MSLDHTLIGEAGEPRERSWTSTDSLLYAIGGGAGLGDPLRELEFSTENSEGIEQKVLPTYGVLLAQAGAARSLGDFNRAILGPPEQYVELPQPLPVAGTLRATATVTGIYDKGSGALVESESVAVDAATGEPMITTRSSTFIRGEGGFGGDRGTAEPWQLPDRAPDHKVVEQTRPEQALLYRLSGDRNPLHVDPKFAARGGFSRPILHGLCTYGVTGRGSSPWAAGSARRCCPVTRWWYRSGPPRTASPRSRPRRKTGLSSSTGAGSGIAPPDRRVWHPGAGGG